MLQTIQGVAAQVLAADGDEADTRRRHAEAFLALALAAREHESTHDRAVWIERLAADDANIRSAVHWAIDSDEAHSRCASSPPCGGTGRSTAT